MGVSISLVMSSGSKPSEKNKLLIGFLIVVIVIGALAIGFWIGSRPLNPKQNESNQNQLTIASFEAEVMEDDPTIQAYLDLEIDDYWVEGDNVRCSGTVKWHTTEYTLEGMSVCMFITRNQTNSVNVKVDVYGGMLLLPTGTIDSDSVQIPKLGEQLFSFDFSLTCTYE